MKIAWWGTIQRLTSWVPFPAMTAMVIWLYVVEEEFPFSNFPMYSNVSDEAEVIFVTNQKDEPLPMRAVFKTSSSSTKKIFNREVTATANANQRDSERATAEDRHQAALKVLNFLYGRIIHTSVPEGTNAIRLKMITLDSSDDVDHDDEIAEWLAEIPYQKPISGH